MRRQTWRTGAILWIAIACGIILWSGQPSRTTAATIGEVEWQIEMSVAFTAAQTRAPDWEQSTVSLTNALASRLQQHGTTLQTLRAPATAQGTTYNFVAQGKGTAAQFRQVMFDDLSPLGGMNGGPTTLSLTGAVTAGERVALTLESNPASGYGWNIQQIDQTAIKQTTAAVAKSKTNVLGAPIQHSVNLQAVRDGSTTVTLAYQRSWQAQNPATRRVTLRTARLATLADLTNPAPAALGRPADTSPMRTVKVARAVTTMPPAFDWRSQSKVTTVRDQGNCGSCWAFGTVGAFESSLLINSSLTTDLSEQYLVSCNTNGWSCSGGWWAHDYHVAPGAVAETAFPYTASNSTCVSSLAHPYQLNSWRYISDSYSVPSADAIKQAIYTYGPVSAAVCVGSGFQRYTGGVFATDETSACGWGQVNHAIVLVGWNDTENTWILRNSWGTSWGESGYMRIARNVSNVGYSANYVVYNPDPSCLNLTLGANPGTGGTIGVDPLPNCGSGYTAGTVVTLTATANSGHTFSSWSGDASGATNPTTVTMSAHKSVTANFTITATGDAYEPDDSAAQARTITTDGATQTHTIHIPGDNDWVKFTATAATQYTIQTANLGSNADTFLYLYDTDGATELARDDDSGGGLASRITWVAPASGTYYARAHHYSNVRYGTGTNYDLSVRAGSASGDVYEPDDSAAQARTLTTDGATQTHTIHIANDNDWVKFDAVAGNQYVIQTANLGSNMDTYLHLYDTNGTTELARDDDSGGGYASRIGWLAPASGTYFVRAHHYSGTLFGAGANYDLSVRVTASTADSYEPDDSAAQARSIATDGAPQTHNFHVASDNDWVKFTTTAGAQYTIQTSNLGATTDTFLHLYDTNGTTELARDDDSGGGLASRIVWVAPTSGTYHVRVHDYSNTRYGASASYELGILRISASPDAYEPDDSAAQARLIGADGASETHNLHVAGDNDWFKFAATAGNQYTLQTTNLGTTADTYLYLYGTDGATILARDDDGGEGLASKIVWIAGSDGTYLARVRHYSSVRYGATTNYDFSIVSRTGVSTPDSYEVDNTAAQARTITTDGSAQLHNIHVAGDNDWVKFTATGGSVYTLETLNLGTTADTYLYLYNSDGATELAHDDDSGGRLASRIVWSAPNSGTYYARARHYSGARFGATTSYDLRITNAGASADGYEPDNTAAQARVFEVNGTAQAHNFGAANDNDWVKFSVTAGTQYTIETSGLGTDADTYLYLYGTDGSAEIAHDDDSGPGWGSRIVWTATNSGTREVYARVRNYSGARYGATTNYNLTIQGTVATLSSQKAAELELRVETPSKVARVGDVVTANVLLTRAAPANLLTFHLQYKSDYLALLDQANQTTSVLRAADLLRGIAAPITFAKVAAENEQGRLHLTLQPSKTQGLGAPFQIAALRFRALKPTTAQGTAITIDATSVADAGSTVPTRVSNGKITILGATPKVTSVSPTSIVNRTAQIITISGSGFTDKPTVLLDDVAVADVTFVKSDTLQVTVPTGFKPGSFKVTVVNPDGTQESATSNLTVTTGDTNNSLMLFIPLIRK